MAGIGTIIFGVIDPDARERFIIDVPGMRQCQNLVIGYTDRQAGYEGATISDLAGHDELTQIGSPPEEAVMIGHRQPLGDWS